MYNDIEILYPIKILIWKKNSNEDHNEIRFSFTSLKKGKS